MITANLGRRQVPTLLVGCFEAVLDLA